MLPLRPSWNPTPALFDCCQTGKTTKDDNKTYLKSLRVRGRFRESNAQMQMTSHSDSTPCKIAFKYDEKRHHVYSLGIENEGHIPSVCSYMGNCAGKLRWFQRKAKEKSIRK